LVNALCAFDALGIHFVSLHEGVDTATPNGSTSQSKANPERTLPQINSRSELRNAREDAKHQPGRPRLAIDAAKATSLRGRGGLLPCAGEQDPV
jgi:hypothetical protein